MGQFYSFAKCAVDPGLNLCCIIPNSSTPKFGSSSSSKRYSSQGQGVRGDSDGQRKHKTQEMIIL